MLRSRVIPCLLVHNGGLVKTTQFANPVYVGDPINAVRIFNEKEADELVIVDMDATVDGVAPELGRIAEWAAECRMPLCYGGGVTTAAQAKRIVGLGVEKVSLSAGAIARPGLVGEVAQEIGSQSVVVTIDAKKRRFRGGYEAVTHNAKKSTGRDPIDIAREVAELGAGEIVLNSVDQDGKMIGYDVDLAVRLRDAVDVPITIQGGAGSLEQMAELVSRIGVAGVAAGSLFVFKGKFRAVLINYPTQEARAVVSQAQKSSAC